MEEVIAQAGYVWLLPAVLSFFFGPEGSSWLSLAQLRRVGVSASPVRVAYVLRNWFFNKGGARTIGFFDNPHAEAGVQEVVKIVPLLLLVLVFVHFCSCNRRFTGRGLEVYSESIQSCTRFMYRPRLGLVISSCKYRHDNEWLLQKHEEILETNYCSLINELLLLKPAILQRATQLPLVSFLISAPTCYINVQYSIVRTILFSVLNNLTRLEFWLHCMIFMVKLWPWKLQNCWLPLKKWLQGEMRRFFLSHSRKHVQHVLMYNTPPDYWDPMGMTNFSELPFTGVS